MDRDRHTNHRRSDRDREREGGRDSSRRSRHDDSGRSRDKGRKRERSHSQEKRSTRDDGKGEPGSRHASKHSRHDHEKRSSTRERQSGHRESTHRRPAAEENGHDRTDKPDRRPRSTSRDEDAYDPMDPDGLGSDHMAEAEAPDLEFDAGVTPEEIAMMAAMGIPFGFDTTSGKEVDDVRSNAGAVKAKQTRQARQYMNRRGGFNRPLPAEKTGEKVNLQ